MRESYGFRTYRVLELALYHSLGKLTEAELTHGFSHESEIKNVTGCHTFRAAGSTSSDAWAPDLVRFSWKWRSVLPVG